MPAPLYFNNSYHYIKFFNVNGSPFYFKNDCYRIKNLFTNFFHYNIIENNEYYIYLDEKKKGICTLFDKDLYQLEKKEIFINNEYYLKKYSLKDLNSEKNLEIDFGLKSFVENLNILTNCAKKNIIYNELLVLDKKRKNIRNEIYSLQNNNKKLKLF